MQPPLDSPHLDPSCDPPELYLTAFELLCGLWGKLRGFVWAVNSTSSCSPWFASSRIRSWRPASSSPSRPNAARESEEHGHKAPKENTSCNDQARPLAKSQARSPGRPSVGNRRTVALDDQHALGSALRAALRRNRARCQQRHRRHVGPSLSPAAETNKCDAAPWNRNKQPTAVGAI
jgi:hypothetical protein